MKVTAKDLTLEEKVALVKGASFFRMSGVKSKGMDGLLCLDGGTGLNFEQLFGDFCSLDEEKKKYFGSKILQNVITFYYEPGKLSACMMWHLRWEKKQRHMELICCWERLM